MIDPAANSAAVAAAARAAIRDIPDFPKPGILFKDITPLLSNEALFREVTATISAEFAGQGVSHVVGIESRGFIFGGPVAQALRAGFVPVRKPGKLPSEAIREEYALEYGTDALEIHKDVLHADSRVLVVDDVLATGGTAAATCRLIERTGARVVACAFVIELGALRGRARLGQRVVSALVTY
jgi:adenine phosphoribosyltransferase